MNKRSQLAANTIYRTLCRDYLDTSLTDISIDIEHGLCSELPPTTLPTHKNILDQCAAPWLRRQKPV
eukprot:snap_masked-scaffold_17-processed-gene-4.5-mRNA-1 protein AED:1.00 eAED:1.00 QI:0/0/0/0/1/1/2/0/66